MNNDKLANISAENRSDASLNCEAPLENVDVNVKAKDAAETLADTGEKKEEKQESGKEQVEKKEDLQKSTNETTGHRKRGHSRANAEDNKDEKKKKRREEGTSTEASLSKPSSFQPLSSRPSGPLLSASRCSVPYVRPTEHDETDFRRFVNLDDYMSFYFWNGYSNHSGGNADLADDTETEAKEEEDDEKVTGSSGT